MELGQGPALWGAQLLHEDKRVDYLSGNKHILSCRTCHPFHQHVSYDESPMILANLSQFSAAFSSRSRSSFKADRGNSKTWEDEISSYEFEKKKLASLAAVSPRGIGPLNCISMHTLWGRYKRGRLKSGSDIHCFVLQVVSRHVHIQCQAESHVSWRDIFCT